MWTNRFHAERYGVRGMYFYEPLKTKAPRAGVRPYCCYVNTVIFHAYPYYCLPGKNTYVEYDRCESEWDLFGHRFMEGEGWNCLAPLVLHHDNIYELGGAHVMRWQNQWVKQWLGWRLFHTDWRLPFILQSMETTRWTM